MAYMSGIEGAQTSPFQVISVEFLFSIAIDYCKAILKMVSIANIAIAAILKMINIAD